MLCKFIQIFENVRKIIILLIFITSIQFSYAQITISSSDLANSGDTLRYSTAPAIGVNFDTTGTDLLWDYSFLTPTGQGVDEFKSFLRTPYLFYSQFFGAIGLKTTDTIDFGLLSITNVHTFFRKRSTSYTAEGTGFTTSSIPLASDYSNSDRVYKLPLKYGDNDTDNFRVATSVPTLGTFIQQGTRTTNVDGWGKITTPYAKDVACIRLVSNVLETDSLVTAFVSFGFPVNRREIKWLSNAEPVPMMEVSGPLLGNLFTPAQLKYRDSFRQIRNNSFLNVSFLANASSGQANTDTFKLEGILNIPAPAQFLWRFTPNNVKFVNGTDSTSQDPQLIFTDTGLYDLSLRSTLLNQSADTFATDYFSISQPSSVKNVGTSNDFTVKVYGNQISVGSLKENFEYYIYALDGKQVKIGNIAKAGFISIEDLPNGKYVFVALNKRGDKVQYNFLKYN